MNRVLNEATNVKYTERASKCVIQRLYWYRYSGGNSIGSNTINNDLGIGLNEARKLFELAIHQNNYMFDNNIYLETRLRTG